MENPFSLMGKTRGQTPNNFTIIKSITIIFVYVSQLKKNLSYFSLLSHSLIISIKGSNTLISPLYFSSPRIALSWLSSLSLSDSLQDALYFFLFWLIFHYFLQYATLPCCYSHQFFCSTLVLTFISKSAAPHESQEHMDS